MWRMSRKPRVVIMPARAPRYCSAALVATVVPWKMWSIAARPTPASVQISFTPRMNARDGSPGVLATLCVKVPVGIRVGEHDVRKRPADIDADQQHAPPVYGN